MSYWNIRIKVQPRHPIGEVGKLVLYNEPKIDARIRDALAQAGVEVEIERVDGPIRDAEPEVPDPRPVMGDLEVAEEIAAEAQVKGSSVGQLATRGLDE